MINPSNIKAASMRPLLDYGENDNAPDDPLHGWLCQLVAKRAITAICARRDRLMQKIPISPLLHGGRVTMALFRNTISLRTENEQANRLGELPRTGTRKARTTLTGRVVESKRAMRPSRTSRVKGKSVTIQKE